MAEDFFNYRKDVDAVVSTDFLGRTIKQYPNMEPNYRTSFKVVDQADAKPVGEVQLALEELGTKLDMLRGAIMNLNIKLSPVTHPFPADNVDNAKEVPYVPSAILVNKINDKTMFVEAMIYDVERLTKHVAL